MLSKIATVTVVALFSLSPPIEQDVAALKREIDALKAQQAAMQKDLDAIKTFLQQLLRQPEEDKLTDASISIAGRPAKGSPTAKVTLVEISDYHCPYCRRHMQTTQPQIDTEFINNGKIQYVFIDYPIEQLHPEAFKAHEAANCAGEQGKYWQMHAKLFATPTRDVAQLVAQGQEIGLDGGKIKACLDSGKYSKPVRESVARMEQLGINSTPTFVVGLTPAPGQPMKVAKVVKGAHPFSEFKKAIDSLLTPAASQ
ncbi:MAG TPA: thioredoxin domain-containing protein [Vicinamibacterales bacterium]|jgi:protein-disulfide isomerase